MTELIIALGAIAILLLVFLVVIGKRCMVLYDELLTMKEKNELLRVYCSELRKIEDDLRHTIYDLTAENNNLRNGCNDQHIAELKFKLCQKQEKIDELQTRLKEQRTLLKQKWEGSRHG